MSYNDEHASSLLLGNEHTSKEEIYLPTSALKKHVSVFGQSGSGKTVACKIIIEEAVRNNVPAIIIDPQGDISSLVMIEDYELLKKYGISEEFHNQYKDKVEVVIFTPASEKGIPLSINPLIMPPQELDKEERILAIDGIATTIANVLGYKLNSERGGAIKAYLVSLFEQCLEKDILIADFEMLIDLIKTEEAYLSESIRTLLSQKEKASLIKRIKSINVGAPSLIFNLGPKLSIQTLIKPTDPNKVRIAIIFLNTLANLRLRELYITTLAQSLYTFIRSNPSEDPQLILYIDELAGPPQLIPPHPKNPPTKQWLQLLFKQGRKYGLSMLVATQNVSDVDYKSFGQVSTFLFGRFVTPQDLRIVDKMLQSHPEARYIVDQLQKCKSGEFYILSPDNFKEPVYLDTRRLYTRHKTLSDEDVAKLYENPPATLCKQIGDYDHDIDSIDFEDIEKELNLEDLEKELSSIRKLTSTPSLLDKQAGIVRPSADDEQKKGEISSSDQAIETKIDLSETVGVIEAIDLSSVIESTKEQYLKYEQVEFKELLEKFFGERKFSYLGTNSLSLAYVPFLYLDFQINAKRRIQVNYANADRWENITLTLPIKRIFPLIDRIEFSDDEKVWNQDRIPIQAEEVFEELISILPLKNLGSLFGAPSSNIKQLQIQRKPETILESFHDVLLVDHTFYVQAWQQALEEGLVEVENEHEAEIKHWLEETEKERNAVWKAIDDKRKRVKQFRAKIEQAKAIYVSLKPLMEDKYKYKSTGNIGEYNKAVETIKFGPEVVRNFVREVEEGIERIKLLDYQIKSTPKVKLVQNTELILKKDFVIPKANEIKEIYAAFINIPVSLAEINIVDGKGNELLLKGIAESALGTEVHLLCEMCSEQESTKMLFVSTPDVCSVCGKVLCQDHTIEDTLSKEIICSNHAVVCSSCKSVVSTKSAIKCDFCEEFSCQEHRQECSSCGKVLCKTHAKETLKKGLFKEEIQILCPDHGKRK
ncbi:MAG: DUF853 family protein [Candidatus Heimdallarchaeota archaeon]|nr:DUF853 family protein [Candidatus Heimdallarchaeota archaeon]MCK4954519.1 DUF853 family protein [Candidatus Heimdallarchaeota archaeon]